jgi:hypothetical protein
MNIIAEKQEIIQRISEEQDESVIHAIKEMLDADWSNMQNKYDPNLERELDLSIKEADNGEGRPHEEIWAEIRKRYNL